MHANHFRAQGVQLGSPLTRLLQLILEEFAGELELGAQARGGFEVGPGPAEFAGVDEGGGGFVFVIL